MHRQTHAVRFFPFSAEAHQAAAKFQRAWALYRAFTKRRIGLVQGLWRMRVAARRVRARRRVHGRAATVVQRWGRRWHGYREAARRRRLRGGGPARAIQRVFRGLRGMRVGNRKRFERDTRAACVIQARFTFHVVQPHDHQSTISSTTICFHLRSRVPT